MCCWCAFTACLWICVFTRTWSPTYGTKSSNFSTYDMGLHVICFTRCARAGARTCPHVHVCAFVHQCVNFPPHYVCTCSSILEKSCLVAGLSPSRYLDIPVRIRRLHPVGIRPRSVLQGPERNRAVPVYLYPHALSKRLARNKMELKSISHGRDKGRAAEAFTVPRTWRCAKEGLQTRFTLLRLMLRGEKYTNRTPAASTSSISATMSRLGGTKDAAIPRKTYRRETGRQADRQTNRQTDRHVEILRAGGTRQGGTRNVAVGSAHSHITPRKLASAGAGGNLLPTRY